MMYEQEILDSEYEDDGTIVENVETLSSSVIGRRIVKAEMRKNDPQSRDWYGSGTDAFVITLDDGTEVKLRNTSDCCAYTELETFLLHPDMIDHVVLGVGTTGGYSTWHIYADFGDVLELTVNWSSGNPFYYGYGFDIEVVPLDSSPDLTASSQ